MISQKDTKILIHFHSTRLFAMQIKEKFEIQHSECQSFTKPELQ